MRDTPTDPKDVPDLPEVVRGTPPLSLLEDADLVTLRKLAQQARDLHGDHGLVKFTYRGKAYEIHGRVLLKSINKLRAARGWSA
mgnify:CR=1 FL=1